MKHLVILAALASAPTAMAKSHPCSKQATQAAVEMFKTSAVKADIDSGIETSARWEDTFGAYSDYIVGVATKNNLTKQWNAKYIVTVKATGAACEVIDVSKEN